MVKTKIPYKSLPETPGVYIMKDADGRVLYVGKAGNLRRRVSSYFERPHDVRIQTLVTKIRRIDHENTDTALEALILEAELIKKLRPPFNVREKDDKSFLYIEIGKEKFPRVLLVRGKDAERGLRFGPFTSASSVREAMHILRRIFPWNTHVPEVIGKLKRPCFDYEVGMCPGTCIGAVTREEYARTIDHLKLFFEGKKKTVLRDFKKDMTHASKALDFEKAEKLRRRIFALQHIQDTALISENEVLLPAAVGPGAANGSDGGDGIYRIEGYDISNISGTNAVGSMVVFENGEPNKDEYRKFKIKTVFGPNDIGMLTEVLERRFAHFSNSDVDGGGDGSKVLNGREGLVHAAWRLPNLVLIDGGLAQANAAKKILLRAGLRIPIIGIAKGPERKRNDIIGGIPKGVRKETLVHVRDEAHRFAIGYHKNLRRRNFLKG
jgi:excinuclease ABC subunit C